MAGMQDFVRRSVLNSLSYSDSFEEPADSPTHLQRVAADSGAAVQTPAAPAAAPSAVSQFETPTSGQNAARSGSEFFEESESEELPPQKVFPKKPAANVPKSKNQKKEQALKRPAACLEVEKGEVEEAASASTSKPFKRPSAKIESQGDDDEQRSDPVVSESEKSVRKRPAGKVAAVAKDSKPDVGEEQKEEEKTKRVGMNAEYSYKDASGQWEAGAVGGKQLVLD